MRWRLTLTAHVAVAAAGARETRGAREVFERALTRGTPVAWAVALTVRRTDAAARDRPMRPGIGTQMRLFFGVAGTQPTINGRCHGIYSLLKRIPPRAGLATGVVGYGPAVTPGWLTCL